MRPFHYLLFVRSACGYSWPAYNGRTSTAELRQFEFEGRRDGGKVFDCASEYWGSFQQRYPVPSEVHAFTSIIEEPSTTS
jgi:hypothetical protein